jgi:hypothetical protein
MPLLSFVALPFGALLVAGKRRVAVGLIVSIFGGERR